MTNITTHTFKFKPKCGLEKMESAPPAWILLVGMGRNVRFRYGCAGSAIPVDTSPGKPPALVDPTLKALDPTKVHPNLVSGNKYSCKRADI